MPLSDIIVAIEAQADGEIALISERAAREKQAIKKGTDGEIAAFGNALNGETETKKRQAHRRAETASSMARRMALLAAKRTALDGVYENVLAEIRKLPAAKTEKLIQEMKSQVKGRNGEIKPADEGGFIFVSDIAEEDFTFPRLVQTALRQKTELEVSTRLFS